MSHFDPVIKLNSVTDEEYAQLEKTFGHRMSVGARWSWNGELIPANDLDDVERMNDDETYADYCLMNANLRS